MNTLNVNFDYSVTSNEDLNGSIDFEFSDGNCTKEDVIQAILEELNNDLGEGVPEIEETDIELTDYQCDEDIHEDYKSIDESKKNIFDYAEVFCECDQEAEIVNAAIDCDIQGSDIDEAYNGEFSSDEDFAQDMAEQLGAIEKNATWPNNCIDWEYAAKELMYDYCESNGHYFRNL